MVMTKDWVDISHSIGAPFGAIGTGYGVYGKFGFIHPNFNSTPNEGSHLIFNQLKYYSYDSVEEEFRKNFLSLNLVADGSVYAFQSEKLENTQEILADKFESYALLPYVQHKLQFASLGLDVQMLCYSPMIPHDLEESTIPVFCMRIHLKNVGNAPIDAELRFMNKDDQESGVTAAFDCGDGCKVLLQPNEEMETVAFLAWYYPIFQTPSRFVTEEYTRYYTLRFGCAEDVIAYARNQHPVWEQKIAQWHASVGFPAPFKRLWFSSLSSIITSTMLSTDPRFFEIEIPHEWVNTMDVTIYSSWVYMINWPEIEKMDMYTYRYAIQEEGDYKGYVWHSLWCDGAHYVEEPCFITRIYRDYLWYNDKKMLCDMRTTLQNALTRVYGDVYDGLIESREGNQSYDIWKMPGVCAYVNMPWLYALYAISKINKVIDDDIALPDMSVEEALEKAKESFVKYLWNEEYGYFNTFYRTETASDKSVADTVFTDQLFGRWLLLIEKELDSLVPREMVERSLNYIYKNNLIDDPDREFRGWVNGMFKDHKPCNDDEQYHVKTCWMGAQLDLCSLLGEIGEEEKSLDVFYSLERSLKNNHLAVGEWNQTINNLGLSEPLAKELSKDTPRFPAYPRYKCSWEVLVRVLGLKMDEQVLTLSPFRSLDFKLTDTILAGSKLTVSAEKGWSKILVDGTQIECAVIPRDDMPHVVEFVK